MTDKDLIKTAGIQKAIVVDDGYDLAPKVDELINIAPWDTLFDDAIGEAEATLQGVYPKFDPDDREELKKNQVFIDALWAARADLGDLIAPIFQTYEQKSYENSGFLRAAEAALDDLGIPYDTFGRDFADAAKSADLIVVDLYLGTEQGKPEFELTVNTLRTAMDARTGSPPSVILMSQVGSVAERSKTFRKEVGLHASGFRWINKKDIEKPGRIAGLIVTLAAHRGDSHALAAFLDTWQKKAKESVDLASADLRRIDIDDLQHTKSLLLSLEGLNTSSYMLDVFDRVLQYEIESNVDVLKAAAGLDKIGEDPPPLTIATEKDPFRLLECAIFVNPRRKNQPTGAVWPFTFGDIIAPRSDVAVKKRGLFAGEENRVFFVASPECDMIREDSGLKTALLVEGELHPLKMNAPILGPPMQVTPVLTIGGSKRFQVEWNFGSLKTISLRRAKDLLGPKGDGTVVARLRDVAALSLRQKFLNNIGRVGEIAPPPKSFSFAAEIYLPFGDGTLHKLALSGGAALNGTCIVHRKSKHADLVFDQSMELNVAAALHAVNEADVAGHSRQHLRKFKEQTFLRQLFRTGLNKCSFPLSTPVMANLRSLNQGETSLVRIGKIVPGRDVVTAVGANVGSAGVIFHILTS